MPGTLFIVATPIGNLEDCTFRAIRVLREVESIVCEDTRVTAKLLARYEIRKTLVSLHEHSTHSQIAHLISELQDGKNLAYVSDAGTPGVNDPGGKLVAAAYEARVSIVPIPGPSAVTAAISVCGFAMDEFLYLGFVPHKKGRVSFFESCANDPRPVIFFESTHRIQKTIDALGLSLAPERLVWIGRELTKMHETLYRGTITEVAATLKTTSTKGEFVIVIGPG